MSALTDRIAEVLHETLHATGFDYHAAAEAIEAELQLTEEKHTYADYETKAVSGGVGAMAYAGQTSRYLGQKTLRRWVSAWAAVEENP